MGIQILRMRHGVDFVLDGARVTVDVGAHDLRLNNTRGDTLHLGALRASLLSALSFVSEAFGIPHAGKDFSPVPLAINEALGRAAGLRGLRDEALEAGISQIVPTPLLFSEPFLHARYLWQDALRFRACRVAIAHVEDDFLEEDTPEAAVRIVDRLGRWRDLFAASGKANHALNAVLNDFGETLPARALWGLRKVALSRPRTRQPHLELLGFLGTLGHGAAQDDELARITATAERAHDDDLSAALEGTLDAKLRYESAPQALAWLLSRADPASTSLLQLVRSAVERAAVGRSSSMAFARPPIALPTEEGITFIDSFVRLVEESEEMHHCVARLTDPCRNGEAFVFHVEREGTRGTVHVDRNGRVVEYRGPFNEPSMAARWGAVVLARWGIALSMHGPDLDRLAWPPGLPVPDGARPLRSVRAIFGAYDEIIARRPTEAVRLGLWVRRAADAAMAGSVGLYTRDEDPDRIYMRTQDGFEVGHSDGTEAPRIARVRMSALLVPEARGYVPQAAGGRFPKPPIALPELAGLSHVRDEAELARVPGLADADLLAVAALAAAGERVVLRCELGGRAGALAETVYVSVDLGGRAVLLGRPPIGAARREEALVLARAFAGGLWAARLGFETNAWVGERRVPMGGEALRTVAECSLVYSRTCDKRADRDGALGAFYAEHVERATRGLAWMVARDRAAGLVSVLDGTGRVVARTESVLGAAGVFMDGPESLRGREPVRRTR